ncbi:hypothetical protein [Candidatus Williamhamiltonella defendens]|uniref:hypothetical protein n=1 Tax=Candidatus Williamhamiltonella defendens TaxID=138072 RepID=UPI0002E168ED|nr:hypothetical protein [Candidatus Hamiltonella defensa]
MIAIKKMQGELSINSFCNTANTLVNLAFSKCFSKIHNNSIAQLISKCFSKIHNNSIAQLKTNVVDLIKKHKNVEMERKYIEKTNNINKKFEKKRQKIETFCSQKKYKEQLNNYHTI